MRIWTQKSALIQPRTSLLKSEWRIGVGDSIPNFSPIFQQNHQTLEGSFSSVSKPIFATKYSFCSIFRDLQDLQTFAPLQIRNFRYFSIFRKKLQILLNFVIFRLKKKQRKRENSPNRKKERPSVFFFE